MKAPVKNKHKSNWIVLDTQSNINNWSIAETKSFIFNNSTEYSKYRINITEYRDCGPDIVKNVIRMSGVTAKEFWAVYNGAKYIPGK